MIRVVILGSGNVAQHLYSAFSKVKSVQIVQCYNRKGVSLRPDQKKETITTSLSALKEADIYILAVSDNAIEEMSKQLPFKNRFVIHTSGSTPMNAINTANRSGVLYPLQTLSKEKSVDFSNVPFCIEVAQENDTILLKNLATTLSEKIYSISSEQRNTLHVAAVFVNNFANYMFSIGQEICEENNIPFEILHPLIQETTEKISEINPEQAQTGPAIRNDSKTIERHLKILAYTSNQEIYKMLTKAIQIKYGKKL